MNQTLHKRETRPIIITGEKGIPSLYQLLSLTVDTVMYFFFQDIFVLPIAEIPFSGIYQSQIKILPRPLMLDSAP